MTFKYSLNLNINVLYVYTCLGYDSLLEVFNWNNEFQLDNVCNSATVMTHTMHAVGNPNTHQLKWHPLTCLSIHAEIHSYIKLIFPPDGVIDDLYGPNVQVVSVIDSSSIISQMSYMSHTNTCLSECIVNVFLYYNVYIVSHNPSFTKYIFRLV